MRLKNIIKRDYKDWYKDPYIYEKDSEGAYKYITFGKFIENTLGIAKYLLDEGYKNKKILIISENSSKLMEYDLAVSFYVGVSAPVSKEWKKNDLIGGINELKADLLERNVRIFKKKLRLVIEQQLSVVDEIEELKLDD